VVIAIDALVGLAGCDKSLPGMMMAIAAAERAERVHVWRLDFAAGSRAAT